MDTPIVKSLSLSPTHSMRKPVVETLILLKGLGVEGDAHAGVTVKHRSRVTKDPSQANLRQVHLIHAELHEELQKKGIAVQAGEMGENITTKGIDLLNLPKGAILKIGERAQIEITGLRNPCHQLDGLYPGLLKAVLDKDANGQLIRKAGIMSIVLEGGTIKVGDPIIIEYPKQPYIKLERI